MIQTIADHFQHRAIARNLTFLKEAKSIGSPMLKELAEAELERELKRPANADGVLAFFLVFAGTALQLATLAWQNQILFVAGNVITIAGAAGVIAVAFQYITGKRDYLFR